MGYLHWHSEQHNTRPAPGYFQDSLRHSDWDASIDVIQYIRV